MRFLILHGKGSDHTSNWYSWVANQLKRQGHEVWVPDLPHWDKPDAEAANNFLLSSGWDFNNNIVIGHSAGAVTILPFLQAFPGKVKTCILIGSFTKELSEDEKWSDLKGLFKESFNFAVIKKKADNFIFIHSEDDPICPIDKAKELCEQINGEFINIPNSQHFSISRSGSRFKEFPELLEVIQAKVL